MLTFDNNTNCLSTLSARLHKSNQSFILRKCLHYIVRAWFIRAQFIPANTGTHIHDGLCRTCTCDLYASKIIRLSCVHNIFSTNKSEYRIGKYLFYPYYLYKVWHLNSTTKNPWKLVGGIIRTLLKFKTSLDFTQIGNIR